MSLSYEEIAAFLYAEARAQDEKRWDDWLAFYADDVEFCMPSWDDDDKLTADPHPGSLADLLPEQGRAGGSRLPHRDGPLQRHQPAGAAVQSHDITNVEILAQNENACRGLRFNWMTSAFRYKTSTLFRHVDSTRSTPAVRGR